MHPFRFRLPPNSIPRSLLRKSFFASWGRIPRPAQVQVEENELLVRPEGKGSGTLHVFWPHRFLGVTVESTDSLLPRQTPFSLAKELSRGALGRLLKKMFEWQTIGFRPPDNLTQAVQTVSKRFAKAATENFEDPEVEKEFSDILEQLSLVGLDASRYFSEQTLAWRIRTGDKIPTQLGVDISSQGIETPYEFELYSGFLRDAFHTVLPMPSWRELEPEPGVFQWKMLEERLVTPLRFGFQIVLGPLLRFDLAAFPLWLLAKIKEPGFLEDRAAKFVNTVTEKYDYLADSWILASRINSHQIPEVPITRGLEIVRLLAQQMRSRTIAKPIIVGIDRPWGEYGLGRVPEIDLVQIAEVLAGSQEIDAILIEMNLGLDVQSTFPRDPISIGSMIDQWSFIGKRIYASISVPSASDTDPFDGTLSDEFQWSEGLQQLWAETLLSTLLAKRTVHGIFWSPLQDIDATTREDTKTLETPGLAYRGLIDDQRVLKLAFQQFGEFKKSVLK